jgi:hypothetical protein
MNLAYEQQKFKLILNKNYDKKTRPHHIAIIFI